MVNLQQWRDTGVIWTDDPFNFGTGVYTPEQAAAALAHAHANPLPSVVSLQRTGWYSHKVSRARGFVLGDIPNIAEQEGKPANPGIREASVSTYGGTIPISIGRRRLGGNVIEASTLVPRLIGTRTYTVDYEIPIVDDENGISARLVCGSSDTDSNGNACDNSGGLCDTKTAPCPPDEPAPDDPGDPPDDTKDPSECYSQFGPGALSRGYKSCVTYGVGPDNCPICVEWSDIADCIGDGVSIEGDWDRLDWDFSGC